VGATSDIVLLPPPAPRWIAAFALDPELGRWLGEVLRERWPLLRWDCTTDADALRRWRVDLWLVDSLPCPPPPAPLLWLTGPERQTRLARTTARVWEMPAPILRTNLVDAVRAVHASCVRAQC
jgi:hypothetical protein